jgi:hypothetical protein
MKVEEARVGREARDGDYLPRRAFAVESSRRIGGVRRRQWSALQWLEPID